MWPVKMRTVSLSGILMMIVIVLSSCDLLTGDAIEDTNSRITFSCSGSTSVSVNDVCRSDEDDVVKVLVRNNGLNNIVSVDVNIQSLDDEVSHSESMDLEIDEVRVVEADYPRSMQPEVIEIIPYFLSHRGVEDCSPEVVEFDTIRYCEN